jgi:hypothetical protein
MLIFRGSGSPIIVFLLMAAEFLGVCIQVTGMKASFRKVTIHEGIIGQDLCYLKVSVGSLG